MLFNSLEFAVFFLIVFLLYGLVASKNLKAQNILLLIASYIFYGWWDWRFLFLLILLSLTNYFIGIGMEINKKPGNRKLCFLTGLIVNIGVLAVFKYFNFFIDSFIDMVSLFGYDLPRSTTKIVLPLGISFYVFLSLSYIIDIYKENIIPERNIVEVLLSLGFFPIILAGPIQRPALLLPQIKREREFDYDHAVDGLRQILWGLFMKIVIADNLAYYVNDIFSNYSDYSGSTLLIGVIFYSVQIYADFAGYSDIAIGLAKLLGFNLMRNFAFPYLSRDITEFWKRWHISLTMWFRDYVFLPLSFAVADKINKGNVLFIRSDMFVYIVASILTWLLTGLWHGADYTFIAWGIIHGSFLILYQWQRKPRKNLFKKLGITNNNPVLIALEVFITVTVVMIAWVFFRAESIIQALVYINRLFSASLFSVPQVLPLKMIAMIGVLIILEFLQRNRKHVLELGNMKSGFLRWSIYLVIVVAILIFGEGQEQFIYFQF
jgi:D-alanyl-lipoteichoic acid acyltransferase DltB (MBOAT superfamily)